MTHVHMHTTISLEALDDPGPHHFIAASYIYGCLYGTRGCAGILKNLHGQGHTRLCLAASISAAKAQVKQLLPFQSDWIMSGLHLLPYFDLHNNMCPYWMQLKRIAIPWENVTAENTSFPDFHMSHCIFL